MKDWKWASVNGWPERMIAARSHSINSAGLSVRLYPIYNSRAAPTLIEICFVKVVRSGNIHIVQACDLEG